MDQLLHRKRRLALITLAARMQHYKADLITMAAQTHDRFIKRVVPAVEANTSGLGSDSFAHNTSGVR